MAKGPRITDGIRWVIARIYLEHPDWRAKEVRMELSTWLCKENPELNPDWPGLSTVQKELTKIRENDKERPSKSKGLDNPWSIGALVEYDIPAQAIPTVLRVGVEMADIMKRPLSIREAMWVGRLHSLTQDINTLIIWAATYAIHESLCEFTGTKLDTSDNDTLILADPFAGTAASILRADLAVFSEEKQEAFKKWYGESCVERMEKDIGLTLEKPHFTIGGLQVYISLLLVIKRGKQWSNLSKEEQEKYVISLRDWVRGQEEQPEPTEKFPWELIRRFDPELAEEN